MKKHDVKTEDNVVTKGVHDVKTEDNIGTNEEQISCIDEELEKRVSAKMKEFNRKIELGQKLNKIMDKHGYNENGLDNDMMVALKTYELHGKNKEEYIYMCTYCGNRKVDNVLKCVYCGNLSFVKTDEQWELMLNNKELYDEELEKRVYDEMEEFNRKIEIVRKVH